MILLCFMHHRHRIKEVFLMMKQMINIKNHSRRMLFSRNCFIIHFLRFHRFLLFVGTVLFLWYTKRINKELQLYIFSVGLSFPFF
ncbi:hypothetical protein PHAVU_008G174800 [Phaseolus vulgaris]|uniref:Uncharacterized protein n=1 Tax=Phaseolus vulgaris TaxID=3885 RepID=V7B9R0_PHAVU|nr:hypothetical protein PHAVU_008G174800g [Phaseolus vulgaris]ESW13186.1 hypothetical protein PHAVU_008G174800g [Phaseolus vulgaris]